MAYNPTNGVNVNAIDDNEYYDIVNGNATETLYFSEIYGFNISTFDASHPNLIINVTTAAAFITALGTIETNGGGTINLAAGTYVFTSQLQIPSNTIIQGDGKNTTILQFNKADTDGIKIKHKHNIVMRDFTWDGLSVGKTGITAWYTNNLLFERIIFKNWGNASSVAGSGVTFRYSSQATVRYVTSNGNQFHGISCKDHFCSSCVTTQDLIDRYVSEADELNGSSLPLYGVPFTQKCIIHSNVCNNSVAEYGIDWHGLETEICGNQFTGNSDGCKFPDGQLLYIHNNIFEQSGAYGLWFYDTYNVTDHDVENICVFDNIIRDNPDGINAKHGAQIHVTNNTYTNNDTDIDVSGSGGATVTTCTGSYEATDLSITVDSGECSACNVSALGVVDGTASFVITNDGPDTATNVVLTVYSNGGSIKEADSYDDDSAAKTIVFNSAVATFTFASIDVASTATAEIVMNLIEGFSYTPTATVTASQNDPNQADNSVSAPVLNA